MPIPGLVMSNYAGRYTASARSNAYAACSIPLNTNEAPIRTWGFVVNALSPPHIISSLCTHSIRACRAAGAVHRYRLLTATSVLCLLKAVTIVVHRRRALVSSPIPNIDRMATLLTTTVSRRLHGERSAPTTPQQ